MDRDEQAIRSLVATWMQATAARDLPRVLELMADDVVFPGAGRPPMRGKNDFAAASKAMQARRRHRGDTTVVSTVQYLLEYTNAFLHTDSCVRLTADGRAA